MDIKALLPIGVALITTLTGCNERTQTQADERKEETVAAFDSLLAQHELDGTIVIYDAQNKQYYSNDFEWATNKFLPASTFKIPNTLIALETNVVDPDSTVFFWDGQPRAFSSWEKDFTLKEAFQASCVDCYREVARNVGLATMLHYLDTLNYPGMLVDSATLDNFWLTGSSQLSPMEEIDFLERFYTKQLPISDSTYERMLDIFKIVETDSYRLSGKTGWSIDNNENNGWFVGYLETGGEVYYFATNAEPVNQEDLSKFIPGRMKVTREALAHLGLM
ncbi:class D beta-lactamase [Parapedobacter tibetensis]|uniref:class D beta-lactamase n=1 Tax=Parapedobacter tibetensis TaxID=2972951 RepID=UPI00214DC28F|nr:class D beta-lactamase [Parapedobacter tibetensis]